jgi:hypothetical protein
LTLQEAFCLTENDNCGKKLSQDSSMKHIKAYLTHQAISTPALNCRVFAHKLHDQNLLLEWGHSDVLIP